MLLVVALSSCGSAVTYNLRGNSISPDTDLKLTADPDSGRNLTTLELEASHLTPADRLIDGGTTYVVWARRDNTTPWVRLGALDLSSDGRKGYAKLTVSETAFDLEVSAEQHASVASPSDKTLFSQRVDGS